VVIGKPTYRGVLFLKLCMCTRGLARRAPAKSQEKYPLGRRASRIWRNGLNRIGTLIICSCMHIGTHGRSVCLSVRLSIDRSVGRSLGLQYMGLSFSVSKVGRSVLRPFFRSVGWSIGRSVGRSVTSRSVDRSVSQSGS
jgi:hypothetical protein